MIGFDATIGTPESSWLLDDVESLPLPRPSDRVLVLAAHPDDETLGVGGLIAACTRLGVPVSVVVATDGENSHPYSPTHRPDRLARLRRLEVQAAMDVLTPGITVRFLGLPDGGLAQARDALATRIQPLARTATHILSPWSGDRHPDHEACGEAAAGLAAQVGARHWQYPIWAWHWADPDGPDLPRAALRRLPLTAADREHKARALSCHRSQHSALSPARGDEAILTPQMLAHFERPDDYVLLGAPDASAEGYFDALYAAADDPWGLGERFYERRKRALSLAALPRPRFRRAFEPGCASGLITAELAARCDEVLAWDVADRALEQTRHRLAEAEHVGVAAGHIPVEWPAGRFDLIVLSEVGYYCRDLDLLSQRVLDSLTDDGVVLACHWRHPAPEHPHTGVAVHHALAGSLHTVTSVIDGDFLLDVFTRTEFSVARADGVLS